MSERTELDEIRQAVAAKEFTQTALAAAAEMPLTTVSEIVRGEIVNPGFYTVRSLYKALSDLRAGREAAPVAVSEG
jgi:transcriptional regulator with XRE-family HTH domain